ncbi:MAG: prolipoprotein diacylglyceryl transferase [Clostridia bacterium]|nr:prolipoprotein diacylglyceryl transferase [Clostridia bacterium]
MNSYVEFPGLGLFFPVSDTIVSFDLFGIDVNLRWYGLLIAVGFLLAVVYAFRRADDFKIKIDPMIDVVLVCTVMAFIGARLYYVLFSDNRAAYFADPLTILQVWNGGLAIYGGIIGAFVTALWMCPLRKVDTLRMFDIASPGFLIGQAVGRWGNFFNQEAFGGNTTLPWGMTGSEIAANTDQALVYDRALPVHPTFLYESLWCLAGLLLLHIVSKKAYKFKGEIFTLYIMWYGTGRFFIEMLRTDSLMLGSMRVSCLVAALCVLGGLALFFVFRAARSRTPKDIFAETEVDGTTLKVKIGENVLAVDMISEEEWNADIAQEKELENTQQEGQEETDNGTEN